MVNYYRCWRRKLRTRNESAGNGNRDRGRQKTPQRFSFPLRFVLVALIKARSKSQDKNCLLGVGERVGPYLRNWCKQWFSFKRSAKFRMVSKTYWRNLIHHHFVGNKNPLPSWWLSGSPKKHPPEYLLRRFILSKTVSFRNKLLRVGLITIKNFTIRNEFKLRSNFMIYILTVS